MTDKNGHFKLSGVGILILSNIKEPIIGVFKAGYMQPYLTYWSQFKKHDNPDIDVEGKKLVFRLRQMTFEQRRKRHVEIRGPGTLEKID